MTGLSPESIGLTPSVSAELEQMLLQLTVQANETRAAAETQLNDKWLMQAPHLLLAGLARLAAHHTDLHVRGEEEDETLRMKH